EGPEQVLVVRPGRFDDAAVGRHDLRGNKVVAGQTDFSMQPANSTAERITADSNHGNDRTGRGQSKLAGRGVEVAPRCAAIGSGYPPVSIDGYAVEPSQVDDEPAIADREARGIVPPGTNGHEGVAALGKPHGAGNVTNVDTAQDHGGLPIDRGIPDTTRRCVTRQASDEQLSLEGVPQFPEGSAVNRDRVAIDGFQPARTACAR